MKAHSKRIYDAPARTDGTRILVDRLWPRGISKERAHIAGWFKDCSPSNELRQWFHGNPEKRWPEFQKKYRAELRANARTVAAYFRKLKKPVTLVTGVRDLEHSHIPVLVAFLAKI